MAPDRDILRGWLKAGARVLVSGRYVLLTHAHGDSLAEAIATDAHLEWARLAHPELLASPIESLLQDMRLGEGPFEAKPFSQWTIEGLLTWAFEEGRKDVLEDEDGVCTFDFHRAVMESEEERHGDTCGCGASDEEHEVVRVCPEPKEPS
jgi:hypothetical protein